MPTIKFIEYGGTEHPVHADIGQTLMNAAVSNMVPGIVADCAGNCSCATCHGYVDEAWTSRVPAAEPSEVEMLTCAVDVRENSRLTCQIRVTAELDGLVLRLPRSQT